MSAAVFAAPGLNLTEKWWPDIQEALIGALFILAATASSLLLIFWSMAVIATATAWVKPLLFRQQ